MNYNPDDVGIKNGHIFGLPHSYNDAELVILPVPWEVTVSYNAGTAKGPQAILDASSQIDLYSHIYPDAWKKGIYMLDISQDILQKNNQMRSKSKEYISMLEAGANIEDYPLLKNHLSEINEACNELRKWVFEQVDMQINRGKKVVLLGGDHSTPLGYMQRLAQDTEFGILQIDAHADLRNAYEGFDYSHASIMYNAIKEKNITHLVQVGIRDVSEGEVDLINKSDKIRTFFDWSLKAERFKGATWHQQVMQIIEELPQNVYISFDIDGLQAFLCPNTGTPVAGGLMYEEALYLIQELAKSGKKIIGFDLNEVAPGDNEWDANVGTRILFALSSALLLSNQ